MHAAQLTKVLKASSPQSIRGGRRPGESHTSQSLYTESLEMGEVGDRLGPTTPADVLYLHKQLQLLGRMKSGFWCGPCCVVFQLLPPLQIWPIFRPEKKNADWFSSCQLWLLAAQTSLYPYSHSPGFDNISQNRRSGKNDTAGDHFINN